MLKLRPLRTAILMANTYKNKWRSITFTFLLIAASSPFNSSADTLPWFSGDFTNNGTISGDPAVISPTSGGYFINYSEIELDGDSIGTAFSSSFSGSIQGILNYGTITTNNINNGVAIFNTATVNTITNNLNASIISTGSNGYGIANEGTIVTITNSGIITGTGNDVAIMNYGGTITTINNLYDGRITGGIYNKIDEATIGTIINSGTMNGSTHSSIINTKTIRTITNTGSMYNTSGFEDITNSATGASITSLNNGQGAGNDHGALKYAGALPTNYNIIVRSPSYYGQLAVYSPSSATTFGIYFGGVDGVGASTLTKGTYSSVLDGITSANLTGARSGNYNGFIWRLNNSSGNIWDLIVSGASTADTQSSLHTLTSRLRGGFSSQAIATNFANMNTYDCDLFDERGLCISVGGQQTYVDNPSSNQTSGVLTVGYKVSPQIRIGGFLNQNINNNTASSVHMSNANPLMGLFAVWNQNEDHLGYQVKVANAYQDKDVTTTRDAVATSEPGRGKTELNTQSYVGELSYAFLANEDKTLVRPYAALRYTRIKQDGYTEETSSAVTAPLTYASLSDRSTSVLIGVKLDHRLADNLHVKGSVGIEQDIYHHVDNLTATGVSGLTSENFNDNIKRTRPVASIGAYFSPAKNQRITADLYYQQLPFQSTGSTTAYVNYMIGF